MSGVKAGKHPLSNICDGISVLVEDVGNMYESSLLVLLSSDNKIKTLITNITTPNMIYLFKVIHSDAVRLLEPQTNPHYSL